MAKYRKLVLGLVGAGALIWLAGLGIEVLLAFARPPQPLPLGEWQWLGEAGVTVDGITRTRHLLHDGRTANARGIFYIVHARIRAPFGLRPEWDDRDVEVRTFAGVGGTMESVRFAVDEPAQRLLDQITGRPGPVHLVRGAEQHEDLVFDLPSDVEQPGFVVLPANAPAGVLDWVFLRWWQPHRFNLRYD